VNELKRLSFETWLTPAWYREASDSMERMDRLIKLQDRVIQSAQRKRRELA